MIFTDITGFTSLVETAVPGVLAELLNEYVGGLTDVVFAHEGTVAKVIGDAIQVLFNAPGDQADYATRAIACAQALDQWAEAFRERWKQKGVDFGTTRIGVHGGPRAGRQLRWRSLLRFHRLRRHNQHRRETRSREQDAGHADLRQRQCRERGKEIQWRPIGDLVLRGRSEPLRAHEPLSAAQFDAPSRGSI